ncbi:putative mitochondrial protein [Cucumis melo var. makuwa]|uniref:Mitochondrial protein n=1 Tax=Cucumis melo var. makuwa TaxID=1194695 RepID=A0A5D3DRK5_CUCMM|nr:putative mitochondrial protein [Cucumis melo var. makuwa]TYK26162.1 putative mitochondrial protein [Cucumis melo var. makuwa]
MVSEQSSNEILENNLGETQIKTEPVIVAGIATIVDGAMSPHLFSKLDVSSLSCDVCIRAKQHRVSLTSQPYKPTQPFTLIHSDVWGPSKVTTSSGKRCLQGDCSPNLVCLHSSTKWMPERKNRYLVEVARSLMLSTSLPSYLWGDAILTAAHLINRMPSRILHLQTPLDYLKESYPSTHLVSEVPLRVFGCTAYDHNFGPNQTKFTHRAQGESVSEESNSTFEFIEPTPSIVSDVDPHPIILPTNQVPWKTYYRRNLIKEVGSPTSNHRLQSKILNLLETKGHTRKLDEYDPSLDIPIALRKECPEWKNVVMEEMKALEKNRTWDICALPKGHKTFQGYSEGHSDHTLFTKASKTGKIVILIVYVDDIVLTGDDQTEISQLKQRIGDEFEIKDLGNLKYFLGMEVTMSKEGISVSQRKYTLDLLNETGMLGCHPADTPIEFNCKLGNFDDQVLVDKEQYQHLVGKLIYLSHDRPNISFVVSVVSQFIQALYEKHMEAVNRILRYLKNTTGKGLMFRKTNRKTIEAYTDSDWEGSVIDKKSTSGYCTFVWGNLVTWKSKKQSVVARSSVEAEY